MSVHQSRRLVLYPDLNRRVLLVGLVKEAILAEQDQVADAVGISHLLDDPSAFFALPFALLKMRRFANVETPRIGQAKAERQVVCNPVEAANGGIQQRIDSIEARLWVCFPQRQELCIGEVLKVGVLCADASGPWAR
ncbi:MAG: hypothetical protein ACREYF_26845 [Gammaproteobacteria bacterium]